MILWSSIQNYYLFFAIHKNHTNLVCFWATVFCHVLVHWCKEFSMAIDPRLDARQVQDVYIYAKIKYLSARKIRVFELMSLTQFLSGAHNVLIDEIKGNRYAIIDRFIELQKIGKYAYRKRGYQQLHKEMDAANTAVELLGYGQLSRMPLEWKD
jgi:hypothetical protein